ncbi:hypothetical protein EYF80_065747 [Liparis tanakae]|uniref:Uncharacterized protein n=1 Tax=Liparis tanakae TaxID=230148 RepID=A0A4Z2E6B2_9TELE|nr:hypothetical protein EYF80_065747 [Liparis tanakae]
MQIHADLRLISGDALHAPDASASLRPLLAVPPGDPVGSGLIASLKTLTPGLQGEESQEAGL